MRLRVIGCHGGETPRHRTSAFVIDDRLCLDAGSLTSGLGLDEQYALETVLVSHAHLDHVRDLATIADNRCQRGCLPLLVGATRSTREALERHFFNDVIWPNFFRIPTAETPTLRWVDLPFETPIRIGAYVVESVAVSHTIDAAALFVTANGSMLAYSGDTGPTERLWHKLNARDDLKALVMEVSFPNREQKLATLSGHHTPRTLAGDLAKMRASRDIPTLLFHIKPTFQREVELECAALPELSLQVLERGDEFVLGS